MFFLYFGKWNFLIFSQKKKLFREHIMELFGTKIKNFLIIFQKRACLIFWKMELSSPKIKKFQD